MDPIRHNPTSSFHPQGKLAPLTTTWPTQSLEHPPFAVMHGSTVGLMVGLSDGCEVGADVVGP